jgi:hypothetical protein
VPVTASALPWESVLRYINRVAVPRNGSPALGIVNANAEGSLRMSDPGSAGNNTGAE